MRAFVQIVAVFSAALFSALTTSRQVTDSPTKEAKQMVELMNAGDYAGIQSKFDKEMDAALPLDKSSAFFKALTQQMGTIQKLGEPQPVGGALIFPAILTKYGKTETCTSFSPVKGEIISPQ